MLILKRLILFCAFISSSFLFGQKAEIENFINEVIFNELPNNFRFYHLFPKSIEHPLMEYPFTDYRISKIKLTHPDFPLSFVARITPNAVPYPTVAKAPALQCVIIVSLLSKSSEPFFPMVILI